MRVLGGWIALTPELPAKLLFGRHVWDCAQHADLWGRRLPELRAPAQQSEPAGPAVVAWLDLMETAEAPGQTVERVTAIYRVLKPHLATVYERHLAVANPVYEPPTRRILTRAIDEERRHGAAGAVVLDRLTAGDRALAERAHAWERRLLEALEAAGGVTGDVAPPLISPAAVAPAAAVVAQDLVPPPAPFEPRAALGELAAPLEAHLRALARADVDAVRREVAAGAGPEVAGAYAALPGPFERAEVVGCARIGVQRVVKLRLQGPRGRVLLQERWLPSADGWRLAAVEVTGTEPAP
ncbi:MAG TPA: hypothetical protein VFV05_17370 [Methylomirabilota bacterium]|nr:hypothetical protein [Methylomirabilota bacterium]